MGRWVPQDGPDVANVYHGLDYINGGLMGGVENAGNLRDRRGGDPHSRKGHRAFEVLVYYLAVQGDKNARSGK